MLRKLGLSTSKPHVKRDMVLLGLATIASALLAEAFYILAVRSGFITANEPCGTYLQPYSCVMINPGYQLIFLVSGGTIGFLFYFVNVMHKGRFALRMELGFGLEGIVYAALWLILPRYDPFFSETAYFAEMFVVSIIIALAAFLAVDRFRSKSLLARQGLPVSGLQNSTSPA